MRRIYRWYKEQANEKVAESINLNIKSLIKLLPSHPNLGHIERDLESFPHSFRTCIDVPNYKIIYWVENDTVKIATIFDCRQRPEYLVHIFSTQNDWVCEPVVEYKKELQSQSTEK